MTLAQMVPRMSPALRAPPLFRCTIRASVIGSQQRAYGGLKKGSTRFECHPHWRTQDGVAFSAAA